MAANIEQTELDVKTNFLNDLDENGVTDEANQDDLIDEAEGDNAVAPVQMTSPVSERIMM